MNQTCGTLLEKKGRSHDILLWTPSHGRAKAGRPAGTYIQKLCAETGCSLEDLPEAIDDREGWQERVRDICADGATWWWYSQTSGYLLSIYQKFLSYLRCMNTNPPEDQARETKSYVYLACLNLSYCWNIICVCVCVCVYLHIYFVMFHEGG